METIQITCDSTCDLTPELYDALGVEVISLGVTMGDDFRQDGKNVTADELFAYVKESGELPKTSAISIGDYEDVFSRHVKEGKTVLHINLSNELSASYRNAKFAAKEVGNVHVIDSKNLSTGSGHLVMLAAELAQKGLSVKEIEAILLEKREKVDASFVLQTLDFLHKGGRCSGIAAFGANVLKLRPEIQVVNGKMQVGKKYRGSMEKSVLDYVRGRLAGRTDLCEDRIFITHSGVPEELIEKVRALIMELYPFKEILVTRAGSTISSHCGPNCLGVLFFKQ